MVQFCKIFILCPKSFAIYTLRKTKWFYQNSLGTIAVPVKEKAELLKTIFSKENALSELLATEKPEHTKYSLIQGFPQAQNTIDPNSN